MRDEDRATADLYRMADLVTPMAIRVAATIRIADHIAAGMRTSVELAREARVDADALERLMRHLASIGVLERDGVGGYSLSTTGEAIRGDLPSGARPALDIECGGPCRARLRGTAALGAHRRARLPRALRAIVLG